MADNASEDAPPRRPAWVAPAELDDVAMGFQQNPNQTVSPDHPLEASARAVLGSQESEDAALIPMGIIALLSNPALMAGLDAFARRGYTVSIVLRRPLLPEATLEIPLADTTKCRTVVACQQSQKSRQYRIRQTYG